MYVAIDTETTGVGWHDDAFMVSVAWRNCEELVSRVWDFRDGTDPQGDIAFIQSMLESAEKIVMHHAKFDIQKLCRLGIPLSVFSVDKIEDTQAIAHLLDEQSPSALKYLAKTVLHEETDEAEALRKVRRQLKLKKDDGYYPIPHEVLAPYALKDAEFTLRLYEQLRPTLSVRSLDDLYEMELELTLVLLAVEAYGMKVDRDYVIDRRKEYNDSIFRTTRAIKDMAGEEFNPNSPKQVLEAFAERGVKVAATDKATLADVDDELAAAILALREMNKIKSTYLDAMYEESKNDGTLHPHFRQHGTRTGRMSSGAAEA